MGEEIVTGLGKYRNLNDTQLSKGIGFTGEQQNVWGMVLSPVRTPECDFSLQSDLFYTLKNLRHVIDILWYC